MSLTITARGIQVSGGEKLSRGRGRTELVVVFFEDGVVNDLLEILFVALGEVEHGLRVAHRGVAEALAVGVLADAFQQCADSAAASELRFRAGKGKRTLRKAYPVSPSPPRVSTPDVPLPPDLYHTSQLHFSTTTRGNDSLGHDSPLKSTGGFIVYGVAGRDVCGGVTTPRELCPFVFTSAAVCSPSAIAVRTRSVCVCVFGATSCCGPFPPSLEVLIFKLWKRSVAEGSSSVPFEAPFTKEVSERRGVGEARAGVEVADVIVCCCSCKVGWWGSVPSGERESCSGCHLVEREGGGATKFFFFLNARARHSRAWDEGWFYKVRCLPRGRGRRRKYIRTSELGDGLGRC